ncbi:MAG: hypothetical protein CMH54_14555 [Myxococcales bacterium]|nr:hypothetical protein [Myxococcales bacterium]
MDRTTHLKALRAAQSVVAGTKKRIVPTLAGLALVAYLPACSDAPADPVDTGTNTEVVSNDASPPTDTSTGTDTATGTDTSTGTDASPDEGNTDPDEGSPTDTTSTAQSCLQPTNIACSDDMPCDGISLVCLDGQCQAQDISMVALTETCSQDDPTCPDGARCVEDRCHSVTDATRAAQQCCDALVMAASEDGELLPLYNNVAVLGCNPCIMDSEVDCDEAGECPGMGLTCVDGDCWAGEFSQIPSGTDCSDEVPCDGFQSCIEGECTTPGMSNDTIANCCGSHYMVDHYGMAGCTPWGPPAPPAYDGSQILRLTAEVA